MKEEFNLSEREKIYNFALNKGNLNVHTFFLNEDLKEFINLIEVKVLMNWKGQNEFIDWLKKTAGDKLK